MESCETLKEENREVAENCSTSMLRTRSWEQQRPARLPLPTPAWPAHQRLSLPVGATLKPQSSSKPSCLQAAIPRIDGGVCPSAQRDAQAARGGHTIGSGPTPAQLLGGLWSPNKRARLRPWPCCTCSPQSHPGSAPGEQGHPSGAAVLARGPRGWGCCPMAPSGAAHLGASLTAAGMKPGSAGAAIWVCYTSSPQPASTRSRDYFFLFYCCYKPLFPSIS